jgi:hypothetical protein
VSFTFIGAFLQQHHKIRSSDDSRRQAGRQQAPRSSRTWRQAVAKNKCGLVAGDGGKALVLGSMRRLPPAATKVRIDYLSAEKLLTTAGLQNQSGQKNRVAQCKNKYPRRAIPAEHGPLTSWQSFDVLSSQCTDRNSLPTLIGWSVDALCKALTLFSRVGNCLT